MSQTQDTAAPAAPNRRGNLLRGLFVIVVLLLAALALWYFMFGRWFEETDDAYVQGNQVQITPLVAGTVVAINADDGMRVERGQLLVQLDQIGVSLEVRPAARVRLATPGSDRALGARPGGRGIQDN
ncbi:biotin/lipoyl-binding protein, partial [Klebsiella pneumoniae]|uniref:biotin/lipoyl-binding protein n=1 Tax=Klebsiella pneumoniae TaxID=573 RepID=UPI0037C175AF